MGVWIETGGWRVSCAVSSVTPYMGVWIETSTTVTGTCRKRGHSLYGSVD